MARGHRGERPHLPHPGLTFQSPRAKFLLGLVSLWVFLAAILWLYLGRAINQGGVKILIIEQASYLTQILIAIWGVIAGAVIVSRRRLSWPLLLMLAFLGWTFLRDLVLDQPANWLIVAGAMMIAVFFSFAVANTDLSFHYLLLPTGFLLLSAAFTAFNPSLGFLPNDGSTYFGQNPLGRFEGIAHHPNVLAPVFALGLLIIASRQTTTVWLKGLGGLFAIALFLTSADGSILATLVSLGVIIVMKNFFFPRATRLPWNSITIGFVSAVAGIWTIRLLSDLGLQDFTTGRTVIWESFLSSALKAGWLGWGSGHGYADPAIFDSVARTFRNPHNTWLTAQLAGGYIGVVLLSAFWVSVLIALWKMPIGPAKFLGVGLSVFLLSVGIVESFFLEEGEVYFAILALLIAVVSGPRLNPQKAVGPASTADGPQAQSMGATSLQPPQ